MRLCDATMAILGLGLMGGSLGLDLKRQGAVRSVIGVARRSDVIRQALEMQVCDEATTDWTDAVRRADLIVLATPVRTILKQIGEIGGFARPGATVIDLGSTKQAICQALGALPASLQAVGGHPMCGKETAGLAEAEAGLYRNQNFVLCDTARTTAEAWQLCLELIGALQARPMVLNAARHDRLVATVSHLPYLVSATLALTAAQQAAGDAETWTVAASGFRDTSRLAGSDVTMLMDILLTNRTAVVRLLSDYVAQVQRLGDLLQALDEDGLRVQLEAAQQARQVYLSASAKRALQALPFEVPQPRFEDALPFADSSSQGLAGLGRTYEDPKY